MTSSSATHRPLWRSKGFQLVVGLCVSAACLWWAARDLISNPLARQQFIEAFRVADYRLLPVLLGMLLTFYWLKAFRWKLLLSPLGRFGVWEDCFGPMLAGFAVNNVLPARAGEIVRVMVFSRQTRMPVASVLTTVALERILDMLSILFFLSVGLFCVPGMPDWMRHSAKVIGGLSSIGVLGAVAFLIWTSWFVRVINSTLVKLQVPERLRQKTQQMLETAARGLESIKSPSRLAVILAVSLLKWSLNGIMMYLSLRSFGVQVPVSAAFVLLGVVALGVAVPASPGFFGVIQVCFTDTLRVFPVSQPAVLAASIYYHMFQYIPVTILGLIWLNRAGIHLREAASVTAPSQNQPPGPNPDGLVPSSAMQ